MKPAETFLQTALEARDLAFAYRHGKAVFESVSLSIGRRETVALLGGSGCGKSTLLRTVAGLERPSGGSVSFLGEPLAQPHPRAAFVFQRPSLLPWLTVERNVGFGLDFKHQPTLGRGALRERVRLALDAVGLLTHAGAYPSSLSGGMTQRVALARALAREPALLLLDEPFSALDAITRAEMQALLVELVQRWSTAALLVTHDIDEALLVGDRVLLMGSAGDGPASIVREWRVEITRPRVAHPEAFARLRMEILAALQSLRSPLSSRA